MGMAVSTLYRRARRAKGPAGVAESRLVGRTLRRQASGSSETGIDGAMHPWVSARPSPVEECVLTNARVVMADQVVPGTVHVVGGHIASVDSGGTSLS
jgi:hypothetical protein